MSRDFIRIKSLEGELKLAHKVQEMGMTVSTREFVLQKPHVNYHVRLSDIISIVPYEPPAVRKLTVTREGGNVREITTYRPSSKHYRIRVSEATLHNRSGIFPIGHMQFVLPIHRELLPVIAEYGGLMPIE